jgi:hypothetical protein
MEWASGACWTTRCAVRRIIVALQIGDEVRVIVAITGFSSLSTPPLTLATVPVLVVPVVSRTSTLGLLLRP